MPRQVSNDLLLGLLLLQVASGVLAWAWPESAASPLYTVHRMGGVGVAAVLVWKYGVARGSLRRRWGRDLSILWGLLSGVLLLGTLGLGVAWTLNLVGFSTFWGYSALNVHTALGIGLLLVVLGHALLRLRSNRSRLWQARRRIVLRTGALALVSIVGGVALDRVATLAIGSPLARRPSGSKPAMSFSGNRYPEEIWLLDEVPLLDPTSWRLQLTRPGLEPVRLSLDDLAALPQRQLQAVLDCTGGWWTEQVWRGPRLADLLERFPTAAAVEQVVVTSVTGHQIAFALAEAPNALLALQVGGEPLTPGHGYPVRLALPGWRGYHWVKWIAAIDLR